MNDEIYREFAPEDEIVAVQSLPCIYCGTISIIGLTRKEKDDLFSGMEVRLALPTHDPDTWELFISGTCATCWERFLGS